MDHDLILEPIQNGWTANFFSWPILFFKFSIESSKIISKRHHKTENKYLEELGFLTIVATEMFVISWSLMFRCFMKLVVAFGSPDF